MLMLIVNSVWTTFKGTHTYLLPCPKLPQREGQLTEDSKRRSAHRGLKEVSSQRTQKRSQLTEDSKEKVLSLIHI